jgi:sterol 24-C-methyltransferase
MTATVVPRATTTGILAQRGNGIATKHEEYTALFENTDEAVEKRKANYMQVVNHYYDLVTDFYEYGWGQSFHFAPRCPEEDFIGSLRRHEMFLAARMGLKKGLHCLDVGCGVGGPARTIARFTGCRVTGINNNDYQLSRARHHLEVAELSHLVNFVKADFLDIPLPENSFDAAYAIEATCHCPSLVKVYSEVFRVLKPGGLWSGYEWVLTDRYDPNNLEHVRIRKGIEIGNGLPPMPHKDAVSASLKAAGFEVLDLDDLARDVDVKELPENKGKQTCIIPWYTPLNASYSIYGFKHTRLGRWLTTQMCRWMEFFKLAPKGTTDVSKLLHDAALHLVEGGKTATFTPAYFFLAQKPESS